MYCQMVLSEDIPHTSGDGRFLEQQRPPIGYQVVSPAHNNNRLCDPPIDNLQPLPPILGSVEANNLSAVGQSQNDIPPLRRYGVLVRAFSYLTITTVELQSTLPSTSLQTSVISSSSLHHDIRRCGVTFTRI